MRTVSVVDVVMAIKSLCIDSNYYLNKDKCRAIDSAMDSETSAVARDVLLQLRENANIARRDRLAICQDTGMVVVFVTIGQDVHIVGGTLTEAINQGIREGYREGHLRCSIVGDPLFNRQNTMDNTPAVIHYDIVEGDGLELVVMPKGFGSENASAIKMLNPCDGASGVRDFVVSVVKNAGANACPPVIVGVGIGGTMEKAAILAKKALTRPVGTYNVMGKRVRALEEELLNQLNKLGIGPAGFGGKSTAFGVHVEVFPTHIAGLPVAVNIGCNATRHAMTKL